MQISYNVTGPKRKELVEAMSAILGVYSEYQGAPSFSYRVCNYTVDKTGSVEYDPAIVEAAEVSRLRDDLEAAGFIADPDDAETETPSDTQFSFSECKAPAEEPSPVEEPAPAEELVDLNERPIRYSTGGDFDETATENLRRLIDSKATLIMSAFGTEELRFISDADGHTIDFPWFDGTVSEDTALAYQEFINKLCEIAKTLTRVTATDKPVENEKYAFRCFLLRLGFIGKQYGKTRKILMTNLTGNSAFKTAPATPALADV